MKINGVLCSEQCTLECEWTEQFSELGDVLRISHRNGIEFNDVDVEHF